MRAVISVLRAAGAVKQKFPEEEEDVLMLKSLKDVNLPKFLAHDIPLFEGILTDLFPGVVLPVPDYTEMTICIRDNCVIRNLQPTEVFLEKVCGFQNVLVYIPITTLALILCNFVIAFTLARLIALIGSVY
jgi:dynein heavy chain